MTVKLLLFLSSSPSPLPLHSLLSILFLPVCAGVCVAGTTTHARGDYSWETSRPRVVEQPCQHSEEGMARRQCHRNGEWDHPILNECYGDVDEIFDDLGKVSLPYRDAMSTH